MRVDPHAATSDIERAAAADLETDKATTTDAEIDIGTGGTRAEESAPQPRKKTELVDGDEHGDGGIEGVKSTGRDLKSEAKGGETEHSMAEAAPLKPTRGRDYASISTATSASPSAAPASTINRHTTPQDPAPAEEEREAEHQAATIEHLETSRWASLWDKYGSVELENKGSVARDHLALERTYLSYLRTSLSFASIGIAITQLFRLSPPSSPSSSPSPSSSSISLTPHLHHIGKPLGATFLAVSILTLFLGFHRYFEAQHYVIRGKFPASRGGVVVLSLVAGGLVVGCLGVVVGVGLG